MATTQNKVGTGSKKTNQGISGKNAENSSDVQDNILNGSPLSQKKSDGSASDREEKNSSLSQNGALTDDQRKEHIAIAAYYNAEKRGFSGDEQQQLNDWFEAEKQIGNYYSGGSATNRDQPSVQQIINQTEATLDDADARSDHSEIIDPSDIKRWAKELGVSAPTLREAINRVGAKVEDVKNFLSDANTNH